jgi:hypothetical protein
MSFGTASAITSPSFSEEEKTLLRFYRNNLVYQAPPSTLMFDVKYPEAIPEGYDFSSNKLDKSILGWKNVFAEHFVLQRTKKTGGTRLSGEEYVDGNGGRGYNFGYRAFTGRILPDGKPETKVMPYFNIELYRMITTKTGLSKGKGDPTSSNYASAPYRIVTVLDQSNEDHALFTKRSRQWYLAQLAMVMHLESNGSNDRFEGFLLSGNVFDTSCLSFVGKTDEAGKKEAVTSHLLLLRCSKHSKCEEFVNPFQAVIPYSLLNKGFSCLPFLRPNRIYLGSKKTIQNEISSAVCYGYAEEKEKASMTVECTEEEKQAYLASMGGASAAITSLPTSGTQVIPTVPLGSLTVPNFGSTPQPGLQPTMPPAASQFGTPQPGLQTNMMSSSSSAPPPAVTFSFDDIVN